MSTTIDPEKVPAYTRMAGDVYDALYSSKDYEAESKQIAELIKQRSHSGNNIVLEAACGTGNYLKHLSREFEVEGFDLSSEQVAAAKKKLPHVKITQGDMLDFKSDKQYDAVLCLFSSIGYVLTADNLNKAIANLASLTKPGGVIIIEPWVRPQDYRGDGFGMIQSGNVGYLHAVRMGITTSEGNITTLNLHHMVGSPDGIYHFIEIHKLNMFTDEEFNKAFVNAGLKAEPAPSVSGRGFFIAQKP